MYQWTIKLIFFIDYLLFDDWGLRNSRNGMLLDVQ